MPTLTQIEQVDVLSISVLHLLLGAAVPLFPTTTRAHPSFWVTIQLLPCGLLWPSADVYFPHQVHWDIWENVVVPLLLDDVNQFRPNNGADVNYAKAAMLNAEDYDGLLGSIQNALIAGFQSVGVMAADPAAVPPIVLDPVAPGEPVDRTPTITEEDEMFARLDTDTSPPVFLKLDVL